MKRFLPLLLGLLSVTVSAMLVTIIIVVTGFYVNTLKVFFFIPVGGIILGALCNLGLYQGMLLINAPNKPIYKFLSVFLSVTGCIGVYYILYRITYISADLKVNYLFNGKHISQFAYANTNGNISFIKYILHEISSRTSSSMFFGGVRSGVMTPLQASEPDAFVNGFKFVVECIGSVIGGLCFTLPLTRFNNCEKCDLKTNPKVLYFIKISEVKEKAIELESSCFSDDELIKLVNRERLIKINRNEPSVKVTLTYCASCNEGKIILDSHGIYAKYPVLSECRLTYPISKSTVAKLASI